MRTFDECFCSQDRLMELRHSTAGSWRKKRTSFQLGDIPVSNNVDSVSADKSPSLFFKSVHRFTFTWRGESVVGVVLPQHFTSLLQL